MSPSPAGQEKSGGDVRFRAVNQSQTPTRKREADYSGDSSSSNGGAPHLRVSSFQAIRTGSGSADQGDEERTRSRPHRRSGVSQWTKTMRSWMSLSGGCALLTLGVVFGWLLVQTVVVQVSMETTRGHRWSHDVYRSDSELFDGAADALHEWQAVKQRLPGAAANLSEFLLKEKSKERKLRSRLSHLSKSTSDLLSQVIIPPAGPPPEYSADEVFELTWTYAKDEKVWPYVGSEKYIDFFPRKSRHYYNSLAVFPHANRTRMHGIVGINANGTRAFKHGPPPPPIDDFPGGKDAALKFGGFYLNLSNYLPLDRDPVDAREEMCKNITYDLKELDDVSVVITFYNEPPSTLLRSVHSVLNLTPPPLLREIILVDDHSNLTTNLPGGELEQYMSVLPKVKLMRLPERRGLVSARLAGMKIARAPVLVVLDSHIEVNPGWLEPQLKRLKESPKSVVFPQIMATDTETFNYNNDAGIGCFLSFKWSIQERPYFTGKAKSVDPVSSPSMAGGLFAVKRDWFFESGAYDEEFSMWGAENVEMGFRIWMCGGRVECTPCARTYHIYRNGRGAGYKSPPESLWKNRLRTARIWMDEWYQVVRLFVGHEDLDIGPLDKMLELKERLQCKNFSWFLQNVDPERGGTALDKFGLMGGIRSVKNPKVCIDSMSHRSPGKPIGLYPCHNDGGSQGWFELRDTKRIHNQNSEYLCMGHDEFKLTSCDNPTQETHFEFDKAAKLVKWNREGKDPECMQVKAKSGGGEELAWAPCKPDDDSIKWEFDYMKFDPEFALPTMSPASKAKFSNRTGGN